MNSIKIKRKLGLYYGLAAGLGFAVFAWGVDAVLLYQAHVKYYWLKFLPGAFLSVLIGGLAGWITVRLTNRLAGVLSWGVLAIVFSWLVVWLPLEWTTSFLEAAEPELYALARFANAEALSQIRLFSLIVTGFMAALCGILEIPVIDQALFSSYRVNSYLALLIPLLLFGVAGNSVDHLLNVHFRDPIVAMDDLIQFAQENDGKEVSKEEARKMHLSTVRPLGDLIQKDRRLVLIGYDTMLSQVELLVDFEGNLVKCTVIQSQPTYCAP